MIQGCQGRRDGSARGSAQEGSALYRRILPGVWLGWSEDREGRASGPGRGLGHITAGRRWLRFPYNTPDYWHGGRRKFYCILTESSVSTKHSDDWSTWGRYGNRPVRTGGKASRHPGLGPRTGYKHSYNLSGKIDGYDNLYYGRKLEGHL